MFFKKKEEGSRKKRGLGLPFVLLRMCLSLTMLALLGLMVYQAYKHFSGVDPLQVDPKTAIFSLITSQEGSDFAKKLLTLDIKDIKQGAQEALPVATPSFTPTAPLLFRFAIVADTHNDNANLARALVQAKAEGAKFVIGLGDYSDVGTLEELQNTKKIFDGGGLPYYVTVGDHDLWDCRNRHQPAACNFNQVFGPAYQSFVYSDVRFVLVFDSDNYDGIDEAQMGWLRDQLSHVKASKPKLFLAFMQEPLYHPSSDHRMGKTTPALGEQAKQVVEMLKEAGVAEIFAGDTHFFTQYSDPVSGVKMTTVGAVTETRNVQKPRFALVDVYEDGKYNIQDANISSH